MVGGLFLVDGSVSLCVVAVAGWHVAKVGSLLIDHVLIILLLDGVLVWKDTIIIIANRQVKLIPYLLIMNFEVFSLLFEQIVGVISCLRLNLLPSVEVFTFLLLVSTLSLLTHVKHLDGFEEQIKLNLFVKWAVCCKTG